MRSDAALMRAARKDPAAFRELYERYATRIYGFNLARTSDADAAFDLTAETFAQAWLARSSFRDESNGSAGPWLFGIARHLVAQSVRSRRIESRACERLGIRDRLDEPRATVEPQEAWLDGLDEAFAGRPACRGRAARDRGPRLRRRRGRSGHDTGRCPRAGRARPRPAPSPTLGNRKGGSLMTDSSPHLDRLGAALEESAAAELRVARRTRRRFAAVAVALAILIPGAALAAVHLSSNDEVAASMPAGALELEGTHPACTTVKEGVEYHCVLASAPGPEISDYKATVYQTVDKTQHVNGGCRSLNSAGTEWECYIGQAAVDQRIISQGFLGEVETTPSVG